jgi:hypothetical protein
MARAGTAVGDSPDVRRDAAAKPPTRRTAGAASKP